MNWKEAARIFRAQRNQALHMPPRPKLRGGAPQDVIDVLEGRRRWCVLEGDNAKYLGTFEVDHVICDPPYDDLTTRVTSSKGRGRDAKKMVTTFAALEDEAALMQQLLVVARRWVIIFCATGQIGRYQSGAGKAWAQSGFWDKVNPSPGMAFKSKPGSPGESIAIAHRRGEIAMRWNRVGVALWSCVVERGAARPEHPTPKPVALMTQLIHDFTDPDEVVLDPFGGSGSTGVGALRSNRRVILMERDPKFAQLCRDRLEAEANCSTHRDVVAGQESLFKIL